MAQRVGDECLRDVALRAIVRQPAKALTEESIKRADTILEDKESRQFIKQEVVDGLIREARLLDKTLPLAFFEADLRKLSFKGASKITEALVQSVCQITPSLEYLDVSGCFLLGDSCLPAVLQGCPGLRSLKMENCRKMTDTAVQHIIKWGKNLQAVYLGGNFNMGDEGIKRLVTKHPNKHNLKELSVSGLVVSASTLESLVTHCPKTRTLGLGYHEQLSEQMLLSVVRRLKLKKLHVHWCHDAVTDKVLQVLGDECVDLEELNICGVKQVTPQAIEALLHKRNSDEAAMMDVDESSTSRSGGGGGNNKGGASSSGSSSKKGGVGAKRIKRMKIRYVGGLKAPIEAIEEAWGDEVDFLS